MRILPISLARADFQLSPYEGFKIFLHFQTSYPRNDKIGAIPIYINYLNNYPASLQFFYALKKHIKRSSVFFEDANLEDESQGKVCSLSYGFQTNPDDVSNDDISHPLHNVRSFFHFPHRELYITPTIPDPPRNWTRFTLCIDVGKNWPRNLTINRDIFQLFTVPIINLKRLIAQPILDDGMHERYPIRCAEIKGKYSFHSALGVFLIDDEGAKPLKPGILNSDAGSYEIEHSYQDNKRVRSDLMTKLPQAFQEPQRVGIDAFWYQPWFSEKTTQEMDVNLYGRHVEGLSWYVLGSIRSHIENPLKDNADAMLQMLSIQKRPILQWEDIQCILYSLGSFSSSKHSTENYFQFILRLVSKVEVLIVAQTKKTGIKHVYEFSLKEFDENYRSFIETFFPQLLKLINVCSSDSMTMIRVKTLTGEILEYE
jgi:type VI secretion system protein ImpG